VKRLWRRRERGQAMIETAIVIAVLLSLLMGVYSVSQYAADQNTAGTATRSGARVGGELGNGSYAPSAALVPCQATAAGGTGANTDPCAVDRQIVQVVCQIASSMPFIKSIDEITVYRPLSAGNGSTYDLYEKYLGCTPNLRPTNAASGWYTLDKRLEIHPNESYVGVSLKYSYKSPTPIVPISASPTVYTVVQESPRFS
jgi:hypothetical protein